MSVVPTAGLHSRESQRVKVGSACAEPDHLGGRFPFFFQAYSRMGDRKLCGTAGFRQDFHPAPAGREYPDIRWRELHQVARNAEVGVPDQPPDT